jgi:hypothetical protein
MNDRAALTPRQEKFAQGVASGLSQSDAYREAYPKSRGWKDVAVWVQGSALMKNSKVAVRVAELQAKAADTASRKLAISKEWVLGQLVENVAMAKQAEPVFDSEGNPTGEYKQNLAAANKALELIGKELGMFVDRKEVRTGALDDASVEELLEIRKALEGRKARKLV